MAVSVPGALQVCVRRWTEDLGLDVVAAADLPGAFRMLAVERWDILLTVLADAPRDQLLWWTAALERLEPRPRLIALVDRPCMELVLEASRTRGVELMSMPPSAPELRRVVCQVRDEGVETPVPLAELAPAGAAAGVLVGESPAMLEAYKLIARVAPSTATVLIEGESGTGKEVVARFIHDHSPFAGGPFVTVNCAAIPENLLESELFGHERGAFTGAVARKIGSFQLAEGGTLFLDEVADMSLALQVKLLRATQEREIQRVGGTEPIKVHVRLLAATNRDVNKALREGRLREDLFYRLAVVRIHMPPLAQRGDDLTLLTAHFVRQFAAQYGKRITAITEQALALLRQHRWGGNVRELRNVVEHAVIVAAGETLCTEHLPEDLRGEAAAAATVSDEDQTLAAAEARHIREVLASTGGHMGRAALLLGIHRNTLTRMMKRHVH